MSEEPILRRMDGPERTAIRAIAESGNDHPVLMLNLNRYTDEADFPTGVLYRGYMSALDRLLSAVGGKVLWRHPVYGQPVGEQAIDEVSAIWYPSHQAFLEMRTAPGSDENFRLRALAVADAVIHRCPGDQYPFEPSE